MDELLQFNSQSWKLWRSEGLTLFLPRYAHDEAVYFNTTMTFIPPDVDTEEINPQTPQLGLYLIGFVPKLRDWRNIEGLTLSYRGFFPGDEPSETRGPDLHLTLPDGTTDPRNGYWETNLKFGERQDCQFEFSLTAFRPSERASKYRVETDVNEFFGQPETPDWEQPEWINEGEELSFDGRINLRQIHCRAPINSAKPVEWARQLARRELAAEDFKRGYVNGGDFTTGQYQPQDGIGSEGRLVILELPGKS